MASSTLAAPAAAACQARFDVLITLDAVMSLAPFAPSRNGSAPHVGIGVGVGGLDLFSNLKSRDGRYAQLYRTQFADGRRLEPVGT
ncbi:MAG: hypothetical protein ABR540_12395 [Acidimicrobiales bacterium]